jgi:D-xylose transport system substrate-binding protein
MNYQMKFLQILFLLCLVLFTDCSRKVKIGFLMDNSDYGRWIKDREQFTRQVEELGGEVVFRASEGDIEKQLDLAKEILNEKVKVLVVVPSHMNYAANIVKLAHEKNVKVISYDRLIKNCYLDFYISFDNAQVGELQAKYLTTVCPKGNYAILGGAVSDNNSYLLKLGQLTVLQPLIEKGDIKIVYDQYVSSWSQAEGYRLMKDCLDKKLKPDAILAANDQLAEGAVQALQEYGISPLPYISGEDADEKACQRIREGTQTMTVYKPIEAIATKAAEIAMQMAKEGTIPKTYLSVNNGLRQVPAILMPSSVVNKETIDLTVVADGYLKENKKISK